LICSRIADNYRPAASDGVEFVDRQLPHLITGFHFVLHFIHVHVDLLNIWLMNLDLGRVAVVQMITCIGASLIRARFEDETRHRAIRDLKEASRQFFSRSFEHEVGNY
jgi:hypothetical protein